MSQPAYTGNTNGLLGYPSDARLLLVNADDFGMYPSINEGIVQAIKGGIVRSTSLMMPCPGAPRAIQLLKEHPEMHVGVHLSVVRDIDDYYWGPLSPREKVSTLLDEGGNFYSTGRLSEMLAKARLDELGGEFRAQVEAMLAHGIVPTHLDWHCLLDGGRADVFDLTMALAREYGLAVRVMSQPTIDRVQSLGLPANDYAVLDSFALSLADKSARYAQLLRDLPVGLSEWAVHPSLGNAESQALDPNGWRVRRSDFDFLVSPEAREIIRAEGIILLSYEPLQKVWQGRMHKGSGER